MSGVIDVNMDETFLEAESSFKILELPFPSSLDWGSSINSGAKSAYINTGVLIHFRESSKALFSNLKFIQIALAKSPNAGRVSHRQLFMGNCLSISNTCETYLHSRWVHLFAPGITVQIALAKSQSTRETSHYPAFIGKCLTISQKF